MQTISIILDYKTIIGYTLYTLYTLYTHHTLYTSYTSIHIFKTAKLSQRQYNMPDFGNVQNPAYYIGLTLHQLCLD